MLASSVQVCVAFGANLGDAAATVQKAILDVAALPKMQLLKVSSLYRSAPYEAQGPDFINAVALFDTQLQPHALLVALQSIEQQSGRERPYKNAPRTLDLDLIFYDDLTLNTDELVLPHPRWHERAFVVMPLAEISPERITQSQLEAVRGQSIERVV